MALFPRPGPTAALANANVRYATTRAFAEGGYSARVYLNVRGREPEGAVDPKAYEATLAAVVESLERMPGPDGAKMNVRVDRPEARYRAVRGRPPDLLVYFDDLDQVEVAALNSKSKQAVQQLGVYAVRALESLVRDAEGRRA